MHYFKLLAGISSLLLPSVTALDVDWTSDSSIKSAASTIAYGLVAYYTGNNTGDVPGNLPDPYYWWEAGAMFGTLIDYWAFTGDETYNDITFQALQHQVGSDEDFMPDNQTKSEGNDDQGFWAMAAMTAAEQNFTNPDSDQPQWLALAQAVYNEYVNRWEPDSCGGGMRWQIFTFNNGFNYKNSVSNGCFFNIASRLARYTGNQTYADWAAKIFEWEQGVGFIKDNYNVLDGAGCGGTDNCTTINAAQFTYNAGLFLYGAAHMYNYTSADVWKTRVEGLTKSVADIFFDGGIMWEPSCEKSEAKCNTDQQAFKGHLSRWMALTATLAPFTYDTIMPLLKTSGAAAAKQCSGPASSEFKGAAGTGCGFSWLQQATFDGSYGVGEQLNALQAVMAPLVEQAPIPYTADTGGSSVGNVNAGSGSDDDKIAQPRAITVADRAGAGILTTMVLGGLLGGMYFVIADDK
ncbi:glycoside hydrolase family 76 protein [Hypoxylon fragiforme]|uniref:glycoside hydrolase family 76 protein n=1 Tax=Hypoxylon fragiforme TaxID=63214 RepID=UPI0020C6C389|nr:glycoside hydrolase family 76 protein [Hypoxylon fragiforme]KAI2604831.1 glycoside hydrolase family 76 protein [Hypoxylon fragiforme]